MDSNVYRFTLLRVRNLRLSNNIHRNKDTTPRKARLEHCCSHPRAKANNEITSADSTLRCSIGSAMDALPSLLQTFIQLHVVVQPWLYEKHSEASSTLAFGRIAQTQIRSSMEWEAGS